MNMETSDFKGNYQEGARLFQKYCSQCHTIVKNFGHKSGPNLYDLFNRSSGQAKGYPYTIANRKAKIKWDEKNLEEYLKDPKKLIPGTKMVFPGVRDDSERKQIVEFISNCRD